MTSFVQRKLKEENQWCCMKRLLVYNQYTDPCLFHERKGNQQENYNMEHLPGSLSPFSPFVY